MAASVFAIFLGIYHLPTDLWVKGYMAMGFQDYELKQVA
jgi:hypothetical protein